MADLIFVRHAARIGGVLPPAALLLAAVPVTHAQEPASSERQASGAVLEEIIVTSRRREERLQDTPISITALTDNDLQVRQIETADSLADVTPNLTFDQSAGSRGQAIVYIRGIGQTEFAPVTDPGVGIYLDDIYLGRTVGSVLDFVDVERIEVLRGPQGTLFGRNTIGGAIVVHSRRPGDELGGDIELEIGSDSKRYATGRIDVPVSGTLKTTFVATRRERDGYVTRVFDGSDLGNEDMWGARLGVLWNPNDDVELYVTADYSENDENNAPVVSGGINDQGTFAHLVNIFEAPNCPLNPPPSPPGPGRNTQGNPSCANDSANLGPFTNGGSFANFHRYEGWGVSATLTWNLTDQLTAKSITGFRTFDRENSRDGDNSPFNVFHTEDIYEQDQWSQEFQLSGSNFGDRLNWVGGVYYFYEDANNPNPVYLPVGDLLSGGAAKNDSWAVFAEGTYDLTDALAVTLGGRYSEDTKRFTPDQVVIGGSIIPGLENFYVARPGVNVPVGTRLIALQEFEQEFTDFSPRAILSYRWNPAVMSYFSLSEGFKSGGFDMRFVEPLTTPTTYDPEEATTYELGLKSEWLGMLRFNVALFHTEYSDLQLVRRQTFNPVTFNAGDAEIDGFEIEATLVPTPNLNLSLAVGYLDAQYTDVNPEAALDPDNELPQTPEWSSSAGASYTIQLGSAGTLTPRIDWSFHDDQQNDGGNDPRVFQESYHLLNAAATFESSDGKWVAQLTGRNLTDETYLISGTSAYDRGSAYLELRYGRPREWGFSVQYNF